MGYIDYMCHTHVTPFSFCADFIDFENIKKNNFRIVGNI